MSEVWNKVYKSDNTFFGQEASNFALLCFNHMKMNNVRRILELGAAHGRDTIFFASNEIEVEALDFSVIAVEILDSFFLFSKTILLSDGLSISSNRFLPIDKPPFTTLRSRLTSKY